MAKFKKLIYVTTARLPTEKPHGLAAVKLCEAFADQGITVDVIAPRLWRHTGDTFSFYDVRKNFSIKKIFTIDILPLGILKRFSFALQAFSFSLFAYIYVAMKYRKEFGDIIIFSHDSIPLYFLSFLPVKIFYDIHHFPEKNFLYRRVIKHACGFAVQTKWKIHALQDVFGINPEKVVYFPNGTDVDSFALTTSKQEAREKLSLPLDGKIALYTGSLLSWKGVDTLIQSVVDLDDATYIYLVGGEASDVDAMKRKLPEARNSRVIFVDFQPHRLIPLWLHAADVLVLPNTAREKVSRYYTSPMKLFEYMASGIPIVATKVPSILEILDENVASLAEPDNPQSVAEQINYVLKEKKAAHALGARAREKVTQYTWENRASAIRKYVEKAT